MGQQPNCPSPRSDDTAHLISRARSAVNRFLLTALREHGLETLSPSHGDILATLIAHDALTMSCLARRINRDPSTVTTLVQKLTDLGYVAFRDNPTDARSRLVTLTERGLALRPSFEAISHALSERMWRGVEPADREGLRRTLQDIIGNFETEGDPS